MRLDFERLHAILVSQVIQDNIWRRYGATGATVREDKNSLAAEKLIQDLLDFLGAATGAKWTPKFWLPSLSLFIYQTFW